MRGVLSHWAQSLLVSPYYPLFILPVLCNFHLPRLSCLYVHLPRFPPSLFVLSPSLGKSSVRSGWMQRFLVVFSTIYANVPAQLKCFFFSLFCLSLHWSAKESCQTSWELLRVREKGGGGAVKERRSGQKGFRHVSSHPKHQKIPLLLCVLCISFHLFCLVLLLPAVPPAFKNPLLAFPYLVSVLSTACLIALSPYPVHRMSIGFTEALWVSVFPVVPSYCFSSPQLVKTRSLKGKLIWKEFQLFVVYEKISIPPNIRWRVQWSLTSEDGFQIPVWAKKKLKKLKK